MRPLLPAAVLLFLPALAFGQTYCDGRAFDGQNQLALSWDACWYPGSTATSFKTFNCNPTPTTNVTASLHLQFKVPFEVTPSIAATATVFIQVDPLEPLPPFYRFELSGCAGSGTIRGISLSVNPGLPSGCSTENGFESFCSDINGLNACSASSFDYVSDQPSLGTGRLTIFVVRAVPKPIEPGTNQWLCRLVFNNRLRADCAGCNEPTTILFDRLGIETAGGQDAVCLTGPDSPKGPDRAAINGGDVPGVNPCCSYLNPGCCGPTDAMPHTWGRIKALYQ